MKTSSLNNQPTFTLDKCFNETPFNPIVDTDRTKFGMHFVNSKMMYLDSNSVPFEVVFQNHGAFNDYVGGAYALNKPCEMCGRLYYDLPMMGIPVTMNDIVIDNRHCKVIGMDGVFHSFECTYAALKRLRRNVLTVYQHNPIYHQSESILSILYNICYPDGGTLPDSIMNNIVSDYHPYKVHLPNVVTMPLKTSIVTRKESIC